LKYRRKKKKVIAEIKTAIKTAIKEEVIAEIKEEEKRRLRKNRKEEIKEVKVVCEPFIPVVEIKNYGRERAGGLQPAAEKKVEEPAAPAEDPHEELFRRSRERIMKLKEMNYRMNSPHGIADLEKEPAYKRRKYCPG